MTHVLRIGVVDQIAYFRAFDTDGTAKTDLTSATTGLALTVFRIGLAEVSIASLSAKAADNTAHADGAIRQVAGNLYTVDLPDAATAAQTPSVGVKGSYTGGVIEPITHPIVNYDPSLVAVGANTETSKAFTFGSGPTIQIADTAKRQITWPTASETITGTIQWDGQVAKAITGAITFRETISGNHFYDWAYDAADRPPVPGYAVIQFTDGVFTDDPLIVGFVSAPTVSAFEARTLPSADYFVEGDYTAPPTAEANATAVWGFTVLGELASVRLARLTSGVADLWAALATMIENVAGWRFTTKALEQSPVTPSASVGDWAIRRTFQIAGGTKVPGVQMSLVGVAGKADTTGSDGIAQINTDDGTFALRVTVPFGYEAVADSSITINGADSDVVVTLVATTITPAPAPLTNVLLPTEDQYGNRIGGVSVQFEFLGHLAGATITGTILNTPAAQTSIADEEDENFGICVVQLRRLARYRARYNIVGDGPKTVAFETGDTGSDLIVG